MKTELCGEAGDMCKVLEEVEDVGCEIIKGMGAGVGGMISGGECGIKLYCGILYGKRSS